MSKNRASIKFRIHAELVEPFACLAPERGRPDQGLALALNQTLQRDGFAGAWAQVSQYEDSFEITIGSPDPGARLSEYRERYPAWLRAVRLGFDQYQQAAAQRDPDPPRPPAPGGIEFSPPFGLALLTTRSVQILHYPPDDALAYRDYLYSATNRRWESLLLCNGARPAQNAQLETIADILPIAANGGAAGAEALKPFADAFTRYLEVMLSAVLQPVVPGRATQPVVAYGEPVWQELQRRYAPKDLARWKGKKRAAGEALGALSLFRQRFLMDGPETAVLCANHPSCFMYSHDTLRDRPEAEKVLREDLVAARWQWQMSEHAGADPVTTLYEAHKYWTSSTRAREFQAIFERQILEFTSGPRTEIPSKREPPTYLPAVPEGAATMDNGWEFLLARSSESDEYQLFRFDLEAKELLRPCKLSGGSELNRRHRVIAIGDYLLEWGPLMLRDYAPCYPYRLIKLSIDGGSLFGDSAKVVQKGVWKHSELFPNCVDFGSMQGNLEGYESAQDLALLALPNFVMQLMFTPGRGTFKLWNFDPAPDVQPSNPLQKWSQTGAFRTIDAGHELLPVGNFVLDRVVDSGEFRLFSFDPKNAIPLMEPAIASGKLREIGRCDKLVVIGEYVLAWAPEDSRYRLFRFDPQHADVLVGPVRTGRLPRSFGGATTLTGLSPRLPVRNEYATTPGTIDFMRSRIKHVVYYMLENRSFDHALGWLYERGDTGVTYIGGGERFAGASTSMRNVGPVEPGGKAEPVRLSKYQGGRLSEDYLLDVFRADPYHNNSDALRQMFHKHPNGYRDRALPDMSGFVFNNQTDDVMKTFSPEQLPVLNGLARSFGVSDEYFCSMPGPTDENRSFAFTGSAQGRLDDYQSTTEYIDWVATHHRASIWKVLASNGIYNWKIYNSVEWERFVFTYHLFLEGQLPSVDANSSKYIEPLEEFYRNARAGTLPAFSLIEPVWVGGTGTTSYYPGNDLVVGERALNKLYEALRSGPAWQDTLLVITFDEHGGIFDHVPPPYASNPWPNDVADGFRYDILGPRVPAILVSPWIKANTVFRSGGAMPYDHTSVLATVLNWFGVPRARWGLGERTRTAPTFEGVLRATAPRREVPSFEPPYDKQHPRRGGGNPLYGITDLQRAMTPRLISVLMRGRASVADISRMSDEVLKASTDLSSLCQAISAIVDED